MLKYPKYSALFATLYLLIFVLLIQLQVWINLVYLMFFLSPFVVLALAWSIIRHGSYSGKELTKDEHWGYQDKLYKKN